jgi:vacuolar-type H+-ATPase subunit E/Vma4
MSEEQVESLAKEILSEADTRAAEVVERAERIVQRVERNAARKADEIRHEAELRLAPRIENENARAMALVELEQKRREACLREELVETAFREARVALEDWRRRGDRTVILERLVGEGIAALSGTRFGVEVDAADADVLKAEASRLSGEFSARFGRPIELTVETSARPMLGGARVTAEDGRSQVDQTFEARFARIAPDLRRELHRVIYSSAAESGAHSS